MGLKPLKMMYAIFMGASVSRSKLKRALRGER